MHLFFESQRQVNTKDYPHYDYYWNIEYDVIFSGKWEELFENFNCRETDFIASHIERYPQHPAWYWWNSLHLAEISLSSEQLIRSFNPIYRISNKALKLLDTVLKGRENWGHHEVLVPTVLSYYGLTLLDFGGRGEFVLPGFEERFYLMANKGYPGSLRDVPVIDEDEMSVENKIYHPVKTCSFSKECTREDDLKIDPNKERAKFE